MQPDAERGQRPFERWLVRRWYGRWPVFWLLPLALLFAVVTAVRRQLFQSGWLQRQQLPVPVVVVGNLVAGGAGKTPTVIALVEGLRARGWHPGVLSRGYGGQQQATGLVTGASSARTCGDEAVLLARRLGVPLAIGRGRAQAGRVLLTAHPAVDCLVCDDGLQHYALQRNVELAVIDRLRGLGNHWLLPAGPLREGARRLRSVTAAVVHGEAPDARRARRLTQALRLAPAVAELQLDMQPPHPLVQDDASVLCTQTAAQAWSHWKGRSVHAVAGIGHPARFFAGLRAQGLVVIEHPFPDHHAFVAADLAFDDALPVLLTEKDAVKCDALTARNLWVVPLQAALPAAFLDQLSTRLESLRGRKTS